MTDAEVAELLDMASAIPAVEQAFREFAAGTAHMPAKVYMTFAGSLGDLRVMPASIGERFAGVKIVNSHPGNPARGLPAVIGTFLLVAQETGLPLAFMGATALTGIRTGAASAVATKYLARSDATSLGLIGAGVQASHQLEAISLVRDLKEVLVWAPENDLERRDEFVRREQARYPDYKITPARSIADAAAADILVTTTPSRSPLVPAGAIKPGTHINAVGADGPGKQELDPQILRDAVVVVDEMHQALSGGEINVPIAAGEIERTSIRGELGDIVAGKVRGRTSDDQITVFDSTGVAIEDIAVASLVYARALKNQTGKMLDF